MLQIKLKNRFYISFNLRVAIHTGLVVYKRITILQIGGTHPCGQYNNHLTLQRQCIICDTPSGLATSAKYRYYFRKGNRNRSINTDIRRSIDTRHRVKTIFFILAKVHIQYNKKIFYIVLQYNVKASTSKFQKLF